MRQTNDHPIKVGTSTGWLHRLTDAIELQQTTAEPAKLTTEKLAELARNYRDATLRRDVAQSAADISVLAQALGVSADALRRLNVGHDGTAWTFPMRQGNGRIIGLHRRFPDGKKFCLAGSKLGLFIPDDLPADETLLICEGASDTAAALTLGYAAIGLPSAGQGFDQVAELLRWHRHDRVIIVADLESGIETLRGDVTWPGIETGIRLAERMMMIVPDLRFCLPPDHVKDLRQWIGTAEYDVIRRTIEASPKATPAWINFAWSNVAENRRRRRLASWDRQASALLSGIDDAERRADLRDQYEERVAICIIDARLPEDEASRIAFEQVRALIVSRKGSAA
jgi:phage/plasmid primase-like uncharacterized protein